MSNYSNSLYKDYQELLEKYDKKSEEYRMLKYDFQLLGRQCKTKK